MVEFKIVEDVICIFCGCVCDDIELYVEGDEIKKVKCVCVLGIVWFLNYEVE